MIRYRMKRLFASFVLSLVFLSLMMPLIAITVSAIADPNCWASSERSRKIHQVVDGRELTDEQAKFSITFDVQGGRDFEFGYGTDWAEWAGNVYASPGEVITVSYTTTYPTLLDQFAAEIVAKDYSGEYYCEEYISYFREERVDDEYIAYLRDNKQSNSNAANLSGTFSYTVPRLEDLEKEEGGISGNEVTMCVDSWFDVTYNGDGQRYGVYSLKFEINVIIDEEKENGIVVDGIIQDAETNPGEDKGTDISAVITVSTVGLLGGAAAVGASAAAAVTATGAGGSVKGNADGAYDDERRKKQYKMYIQKDFGDAIKRGGNSVKIRARISEVDKNGAERDRDDLTMRIGVSGSGMTIHGVFLAGRYCEATVSVPNAHKGDVATITFTYTGEGGSFNNTRRFRVVGEPSLVFSEDEGLNIEYNGQTCRINMIEGDGLIYPLRFTIKDAIAEPKVADIFGENNNGFSAKFEKTDEPYTYIAYLKNNTVKKANGIFFTPEETFTHIYVKCDGEKEPIIGSIYVTLIPEGLSVLCRETKEGFMIVDTNKDESAAGLDPVIRPVGFETVLAYTVDEADGKRAYIVDAKNYEVKFGEIEGEKEYINAFRKSFKYEIDTKWAKDKKFAIAPKAVLPQEKNPYEIDIPISASHNGNLFATKLPIKLYGEQPKNPTEWDKEKALLQRAIKRYGLADNEYLREQIKKAKSLTANELCMLRRAIIIEAMYYYTQEAEEFNSLDQSLGRYEFTFSCVKWIMDQAFSVVAAQLYGPTAEAFMTPFKDLVGQFLGDLSASAYWGGEIETSWSSIGQAALKGCENSLGNKMGDAITEGSVKKLGGVIAVFLTVSFIEKFYWDKDAKGDIYKSLTATCNDLAGNAIKTAFNAKFGDALKNNPGIRDAVQNFFVKDFCKRFPNPNIAIGQSVKYATDNAMKLINSAIEKYVTETIGLTATIFISNLENLQEKIVDKSDKALSELDRIENDFTDGKVNADRTIAHTIGLTYRTIGDLVAKDMFDIEIEIGDSVLRFNIIENINAISKFIWEHTFGLLIPKDLKEEPVTDCTTYYKVL